VGCSVTSAGLVSITGAAVGSDSCVITASLAASANYLAAGPLSQSFNIAKAAANLAFDLSTLPAKTFGDADFSVASYASSNSGATKQFALGAISVGCTVTSAGLVSITGVALGTDYCVVTVSQAATANYLAGGPISQSFHIAKRNTTATTSNAVATLGAASVSLSATVSATGGSATPNGGLVTFTVKNASSTTVGIPVSGAVSAGSASAAFSLTGVGAGIYSIYASYAGNSTFNASNNTLQSPIGTLTIQYVWSGFFQPVDNLPALNSVNSGQAIPVKFSLAGNQGLNIFFSPTYPTSAPVTCGNTAASDPIEQTVTAGSSSLSYDGTQYVYVWKTDKSWANSCRTLTLKFVDGTVHQANFWFTK
jgi:hypothetical protein